MCHVRHIAKVNNFYSIIIIKVVLLLETSLSSVSSFSKMVSCNGSMGVIIAFSS